MKSPKARPNSFEFPVPRLVSAGLQKLPGASRFVNPSMRTTNIIKTVDIIPRIEVYDSKDSGRNTIGINLKVT